MTTETVVDTVKAYWRCPDCLSVYLTRVPKPPAREAWGFRRLDSDVTHLRAYTPVCGHCDAVTIPMGVVARSGRVTLTTTDTVCDFACQMALGPLCDCKCNGLNHGDRLARKIIVLETRETKPVLTVEDPAVAVARAAEFRAALATATTALKARFEGIDAILAKKASGAWVDNGDFHKMLAFGRAHKMLAEAKTMKTHKARMARLTALAEGS